MLKGHTFAHSGVRHASTLAMAETKADDAPGWRGEGKLSYMLSQGNSETETLGSKAKAIWRDRWRGTGTAEALNSSNRRSGQLKSILRHCSSILI